ncbi:Uncharacterised protein [Vibrio cholerae]|nr:Uncharacterised protein [Vibrio cholerae]
MACSTKLSRVEIGACIASTVVASAACLKASFMSCMIDLRSCPAARTGVASNAATRISVFFIFLLTFEGSGIVRHSACKSELSFVAKLK